MTFTQEHKQKLKIAAQKRLAKEGNNHPLKAIDTEIRKINASNGGKKSKNYVLSDEEAREILKRFKYNEKFRIKHITTEFNVNYRTVRRLIDNETYAHINREEL